MKNKDNWLSALIWFGAAISVAEVEAGRAMATTTSAFGGKGARWPS